MIKKDLKIANTFNLILMKISTGSSTAMLLNLEKLLIT